MTTPPPSNGTAQPNDSILFTPGLGGCLSHLDEPKPQPPVKIRKKLEPAEGSDLSLLFHELPELEAAKKEAEEKLTAHKKKIQQEIAKTVTDPANMPDVFDIPADPHGGHPAYTLSARQGAWRLNAEAMKNQDPETYVKWAVQGDPYWELSRVRKNRVKR